MASTPEDRLAALQQVYQDALFNEPHDLAQAATAAQVLAVQQNVTAARQAYFAAALDALNNSGPDVEAAFTAAQGALDAVKQARAKSEQIATLLQKLNSATAAGTKLLNAAKSAAAVA